MLESWLLRGSLLATVVSILLLFNVGVVYNNDKFNQISLKIQDTDGQAQNFTTIKTNSNIIYLVITANE